MSYKFTGGMSHIRNVVTEGLRYRLVDARGEVVGRLASRLSILLQGKDKPTYQPHKSEGDVVVVNAAEVTLTGRKMDQKKYYRHTGYVGGLVERTAREMMNRSPRSCCARSCGEDAAKEQAAEGDHAKAVR